MTILNGAIRCRTIAKQSWRRVSRLAERGLSCASERQSHSRPMTDSQCAAIVLMNIFLQAYATEKWMLNIGPQGLNDETHPNSLVTSSLREQFVHSVKDWCQN
ncbi:hypothetical protein VTL71DRAFT_6031 [Oculimacula yallundae]|uniref:Uncharacterized protein n=1 Tax=Oculimacula yallundae TaxID=86028 RepID=A0ABR4C0W0_9HELO